MSRDLISTEKLMAENDRPGENLGPVKPANDASPSVAHKPISEWTQEDFLAAGVNVVRMTSKTRTVNTATSPSGMTGTGFSVKVNWGTFKFAK